MDPHTWPCKSRYIGYRMFTYKFVVVDVVIILFVIQQLCEDIGCCPEDLSEAMNDREKWRERARDIRASSTT